MKFAICLSGQPRIKEETIKNHLSFSVNNFDYFIHCWWDDSHRGKTMMFHSNEKIPDNDILSKYLCSYAPKKFLIEDFRQFDLTFCKSHDYSTWENCSQKHYDIFTPALLYGQLCQATSVRESVKLALNNDYKFVIRSRPDAIFTKDLTDFFKSYNPKDDEIYFQSSMDGGHIYCGEHPGNPCDWFFCGTPKAMSNFVDNWVPVIKEMYSSGVKHGRDAMREIAKNSNLKIVLGDFGVIVHRQLIPRDQDKTFVEINKYYDSFDSETLSVFKDHDIWPHWYDNIDFHFLRRQKA
jgi:hypothetical protein